MSLDEVIRAVTTGNVIVNSALGLFDNNNQTTTIAPDRDTGFLLPPDEGCHHE